jgi:hypothetical protein
MSNEPSRTQKINQMIVRCNLLHQSSRFKDSDRMLMIHGLKHSHECIATFVEELQKYIAFLVKADNVSKVAYKALNMAEPKDSFRELKRNQPETRVVFGY